MQLGELEAGVDSSRRAAQETQAAERSSADGAAEAPSQAEPSAMVNSTQTIQVTVALDSGGLTAAAREKFRDCVRTFGLELARAIYRLEEAERVQGEDLIEITRSTVVKANDEVRSGGTTTTRSQRNSNFAVWAGIAATGSGIAAGAFASYLHSWWQWTSFLLAGALTLICLTLGAFELRRRP